MSINIPQRGYTKREVQSTDFTMLGNTTTSNELDATNTEDIVVLGNPALKLSFQSTGDLAGNLSFSLNGVDFFGSTAFTANDPETYETHVVTHVKISRTGGSGRMVIGGA